MKENFTYPAIMTSSGSVYTITFPDFPGVTATIKDTNTLISDVQRMLAGAILDNLDNCLANPVPSTTESIIVGDGEQIIWISVWLPYYRSARKEKYVKKTLTVPDWLNELAVANEINFSAVLVEGLKRRLGISD